MISITLFIVTIRLSTSIILASIGGTLSERSGVVNIGLEGMMLVGAFSGVVGSHFTGRPWVGMLFALAGGGLMGLIHAFLCVTLGSNQPISSMGINLFAAGITTFGVRTIFNAAGSTPRVTALNSSPLLNGIPLIGDFLSQLPPMVYVAVLLAFALHYMLFKTSIGLRIRAVGENPGAADALGINVVLTRYLSVIGSGMLAGLAGAYISIGQLNLFQEGMTSGRGYMALAVVIMGRWKPLGCLLASLLFGLADAIQFRLQIFPDNPIPGELMLILPYVLTLVIIIGFVKRSTGPESLGKYYDRNIR